MVMNKHLVGVLILALVSACPSVSAENAKRLDAVSAENAKRLDAGLAENAKPLDAEEIMQQIEIPDEDGTEGKTMDQVIFDANTESGARTFARERGEVVVEGDMIFSPRQYLASYGGETSGFGGGEKSGFGGGAIIDEKYLWPKKIIPWKMTDQFKKDDRGVKAVYGAMKEWMAKTCIVFTPHESEKAKTTGHDDYITIMTGIGCYALRVGYRGGKYGVSLGKGCKYHGVALHELGHAIGLHHEQSRIDRDNSLKVLPQNAQARLARQFDIQRETNSRGLPYDFCSIMHYGNLAFSNTAHFTILTRNQDYQFTIGNPGTKHLTFEDAKIVNILYKCNSRCDAQPKCKDPCYVNHKCECECPPENHCPKKPCKDYNTETDISRTCDFAKKYNRCKGREDMARLCAESCGHCDYAKRQLGNLIIDGDGPSPTFNPDAKIGPKCRDERFCRTTAGAIGPGECVGSNADLVETCPRKCGICLPCWNKKPECARWAKEGKCESQKRMMYNNCNEACGLCVNP